MEWLFICIYQCTTCDSFSLQLLGLQYEYLKTVHNSSYQIFYSDNTLKMRFETFALGIFNSFKVECSVLILSVNKVCFPNQRVFTPSTNANK